MIPLPGYIDPEAWQGFVDMRKTIKKPLTLRAAKLILYELQRIKDAGHDANAALDQSTNHCWCDVWAPKEKVIEKKATTATTDWVRQQDEYKALSQTPEAKAAKERAMARAGIRRVA
jgi:hypothetical protein